MPRGSIEVITGCMFSGKSEELCRRLRRARVAKMPVMSVRHSSDLRYDPTAISSHAGQKFPALIASTTQEVWALGVQCQVLGLDEGQFFSDALVDVCEDLANAGVQVIVAGLEMTSEGKPFGPMPGLMVVADKVDKLTAICMSCGEPATRTFHKAGKSEQVEVGADAYEARCRPCWLRDR